MHIFWEQDINGIRNQFYSFHITIVMPCDMWTVQFWHNKLIKKYTRNGIRGMGH
jgi:hypothetical protein